MRTNCWKLSWGEISPTKCEKLITSMPTRVQAVTPEKIKRYKCLKKQCLFLREFTITNIFPGPLPTEHFFPTTRLFLHCFPRVDK